MRKAFFQVRKKYFALHIVIMSMHVMISMLCVSRFPPNTHIHTHRPSSTHTHTHKNSMYYPSRRGRMYNGQLHKT